MCFFLQCSFKFLVTQFFINGSQEPIISPIGSCGSVMYNIPKILVKGPARDNIINLISNPVFLFGILGMGAGPSELGKNSA